MIDWNDIEIKWMEPDECDPEYKEGYKTETARIGAKPVGYLRQYCGHISYEDDIPDMCGLFYDDYLNREKRTLAYNWNEAKEIMEYEIRWWFRWAGLATKDEKNR